MKRKMMSLLLALAVISGSSVYAKVIDVMSPNGAIKVSVDIKDRIYYSVSYDNDQLLKDCYLNLQLQNETLGTNPHLRSTKRGTIDESVKREIPFKNAIVRNHCNTLRMNFSGNYAVEFRVFDNGIAYRFVTDKKGDNIVMGEDFAINFPANYKAHLSQPDGFKTSYECPYTHVDTEKYAATDRQDEITAYPIEYEDVAMFNPTNGFAAFLIPAVLILIIQQTLLLGIGLSAGTARENNRFKDLVPINRHYNGTLRIVLGKGLSYFMVYALVSVYVLCAVPRMFSLNQIGQPGTLALFILPYLMACIFFAMTASIAIRNRETCMLIFVFTSVPLLFISGISWPGAAIPPFWKYFSYIFPSTFGINGFVRINNMGATLSEIPFEYKALWIQTGFYFLTTCWVYRWQIIKSRKHVIDKYKEMKNKGKEFFS